MNKGVLSIALVSTVLILVIVLIVVVILKFQTKDDSLKEDTRLSQDAQVIPTEPRIDSKKVQSKSLDPNLRDSLDQQTQGDKVRLELFDNEVLECNVEGVDQDSPDITNLLCASEKYTAFFTFDDELILGTVDDNTKNDTSYVIMTDRDSGEILLEEHTRN